MNTIINRKSLYRVVLSCSLILLVILLLGFSIQQIASAKPRPTSQSQEIKSIEDDLQGNLDSDTRKSLEAKLELLYRETARDTAISQLTPKPYIQNLNAPKAPDLQEKRETGIIENPSVPFSSMDYQIINAWQDIINGDYVLIFVGALASDHEQGVVLVTSDSNSGSGEFFTPRRNGAVRVVQEKKSRLVLQSSNRDIFYFDVPARIFVDSLEAIVPNGTLNATNGSLTPIPLTTSSPYP